MKISRFLSLGIATVIVLIAGFLGVFAFAEEPLENACTDTSLCGTTPESFSMILDFVDEMLSAIHTVGSASPYLGEYVSPNRFKGDTFTPPASSSDTQTTIDSSSLSDIEGTVNSAISGAEDALNSAVDSAKNKVQSAVGFGAVSVSLFSSPLKLSSIKNFIGGIFMSTQNKLFMRDQKLVESLESDLSDKKYELGLGGGWYDVPNAENMKILNTIIQRYVDEGLLTKGSLTQARYADIAASLSSVLSAAKTLLAYDKISPFMSIKSKGMDLSFSSELLTSLQATYTCARGGVAICTTHATTFKTIWSDLSRSVTQTFGKSGFVQTIKTANKNLTQIFTPTSKQDPEFIKKKEELWQEAYGSTGGNKLIKFNTNVPETLSGVKSALVRSRNLITDLPSITEEIKHTQELAVPQVTLSGVVGVNLFTQMLLDSVQDIFVHQVTDSNLATFSEVKDITQGFGIVSQQIYVTQNSILGGKNQEGSLIKNLGEACELQCGGGTCR